MSDSAVGERPPRTSGSRLLAGLREVAFILVGALIISTLIRTFLGQVFEIPSPSMENTLMVQDKVVVEKVTDFRRGDIVVFEDPAAWLGADDTTEDAGPARRALEFIGVLPSSSTNHLIKRVIGTPGDRVKCCDAEGRMSVNGVALDERAYLYTDIDGEQADPSSFDFEVVVPAGSLFVMGDNRDDSADSRCHLDDITTDGRPRGATAFVPEDKVVGPAVLIMSPLSRWRHLTVPDTFAAVPAPSEPAPQQAVIKPDDANLC